MATTDDIRKGLKMMLEGSKDPFIITEAQFVKPGKGQPFTRVKLKNMTTGSVLERTYKSGEKVEQAEVEQREMQYIYPDGADFVFMDPKSGEQFTIDGEKIDEDSRWLSDGMSINVTLHNGLPIGVDLPANVTLQITTCEPGVKGDTSGGATKPATLSTGAIINVPLFVKEGEWVKVDTAEGKYLERVNR